MSMRRRLVPLVRALPPHCRERPPSDPRARAPAAAAPRARRCAATDAFSDSDCGDSADDGGKVALRLLLRIGAAAAIALLLIAIQPRGVDARSAGEPMRYETAYACEGKTLKIGCPEGSVIHLIRANYGRFSITICNDHGNTDWSVNCMSTKSLRVLHTRCSMNQNCSILASTNMFGDPCPNTLKYLEAHYQCMPAATSSTTNRPSPPWQMTSQPSVWRSTSPSGQPKRPAPASGGHHTSAAITPPTFRPHITLPPELKPGVISKVRTDSRQPESTDSKKTPDDAKQEIPKTELPEDDTSKPKDAAQDTAPIDIPPSKGRDPIKGDVFTESPPIIQDPYEPPSERDRDRANGQDRRHHHHMTNIDDNGQSGGDLATSPPEIGVMPAAPLPTPAAACPARIARTLHWNYTIAGSVAVQPCPGGATGLARWRCVMVPSEVTYHSHNTNTMNRHRSGSSLQSGENFADLGLDIESADTLPDSNLDDGQQIVRKLKGEPLLTDGEPEPLMLPEAMASSLDSEILTGVQYTPMWHPTYPDLSECRSVWLNSLETRAREGDSMLSITSDLVQVTSSKTLYGGDMMTTSNIMKRLAQRMASNVQSFADTRQREAIVTDMLLGVVKTGSNLLDESQRASWRDLSHSAQMRAATSLLIGLEENAFLLAEAVLREKTILQQVKNILLSVRVLETRNIAEEEVFPNPNTREQWTATEDEIILPRGALIENSEGGLVRVIFVAFDRLEEILQPLQPQDLKGYYHGSGSIQDGRPGLEWARDNVTTVLNSKVISASLGKGRHIQLPQPVRLTLKHIRTENVSNPVCVFWDYTTNNWSGEGCHVVGHNETHTQCSCAHLTNFAILMDLRGGTTIPAHHRLALRVVTLVGCAISSVALVAAILVFHCFRNMKSERVMIHKNLCACLLLGELVFMFGIHQTQNRILCGVIAGFLHYFFLAAFVWMFLEAFHLYAMLVEVWQPAVSRARWYTLCGYGGPLLVVVAAALADPLSYGTTHACWLRADNMFILTFVVPVAFVLVANWICLSMVIYMMCRHSNVSLKAKDTSKLYKMRVWLKTSLVLGVILGLTWTFGLLYLNEQTVAVAYIFTVLNSLQGLFIFIFHCLQNEVFQKECGRLSSRYRWLSCCATLGVNNSSGTAASGQAAPHAATPGSSATPNNDRVPPTNQGSMKHRRYQQAHSESTEDVSEPRDGGTSYKVQPSPTRSCHMLRPTAPLYVPSQDLPHPQDYRLPKSCSVSSGRSSNLLNPGLDEWKNTSSKHSTLQHHHHGASEQIVYNQPSPQSPLHYRGHGQEESPLQPYQRIYAQSEYGRSPHATYLPANQSAQEMIYRSSQRRPKHHHPAPYGEIPGYYRSQDYRHDDPVYEEIERNETLTSDVSDDNSDVARAGERPPPKQYADHRPLISYSPGERHFASPQYEQRSKYKWEGGERPYEPRHPAFAPESNMRSLAAVLNGENVVCHLEPHPANFYDGQTSRAVLPYGDC